MADRIEPGDPDYQGPGYQGPGYQGPGYQGPVYRGTARRGMDPATRRLAIFAASLGAAMVLVLGGISLFSHHGGSGGGVPVIAANSGPMKIKPANPGGMQVTGANSDVMSDSQGGDQGKLAPPPETADIAALRAARAAEARATAAATASAAAARASAPPVSAPSGSAPSGSTASALPAAAQPVGAHPLPPAARPVTAAVPSRAATVSTSPVAGGHTQVQLAALSSAALAQTEWSRLQHRMPGLLDGRAPAISRVEVGGHIFWRLRTGGFASLAAATRFCDQVRAKGHACSIAAF